MAEDCEGLDELVHDDVTGLLITERERRVIRKEIARLAKENNTTAYSILLNRRQYFRVSRREEKRRNKKIRFQLQQETPKCGVYV